MAKFNEPVSDGESGPSVQGLTQCAWSPSGVGGGVSSAFLCDVGFLRSRDGATLGPPAATSARHRLAGHR